MKRRALTLILAVLLALAFLALLPGCAKKITQGEVIDKTFSPAHNEYRLIPIVISNGKTSTTYFMPYVYRYPDTWTITISGQDEDGKAKTAVYRVTKTVFDSAPVGSEFVYKSDMEPDEPEYQREPGDKGDRDGGTE